MKQLKTTTQVRFSHSSMHQLSTNNLGTSWFYTLWWVHWSIFAARVSTRPSDYKPPPDSPHVGMNLPRSHTATPSGVPQNKHKFVVVPRLPNSISYTKEGNHLEPNRTSHDLAHSTRLPKPPGYNLEWPRVTPIQVALVTGPRAKYRIKTSFQSCVEFHV